MNAGNEKSTVAGIRYRTALAEARSVLDLLDGMDADLERAATLCAETLRNGCKVIAFGNGGSACEAQHLAGELMGRYKTNRRPLPCVALTADTAVITCIGNDFNFDDIFARQVEGLGQSGDLLMAFSTSGNSSNVLRALDAAKSREIRSVAFLGREGGQAAARADLALVVRHEDTARIQEGHNFLMHSLMDTIEAEFGLKQ